MLKEEFFCVKINKCRPFLIAWRRNSKKWIFLSRINLKNIATLPLSNLGYPSATPLNFAEFGAPEYSVISAPLKPYIYELRVGCIVITLNVLLQY